MFVLTQEKAVKFILCVSSHLGITLVCTISLSEFLTVNRIDHALLVLKTPLNNEILIYDENIALTS